jgi:hypothetical protein
VGIPGSDAVTWGRKDFGTVLQPVSTTMVLISTAMLDLREAIEIEVVALLKMMSL